MPLDHDAVPLLPGSLLCSRLEALPQPSAELRESDMSQHVMSAVTTVSRMQSLARKLTAWRTTVPSPSPVLWQTLRGRDGSHGDME